MNLLEQIVPWSNMDYRMDLLRCLSVQFRRIPERFKITSCFLGLEVTRTGTQWHHLMSFKLFFPGVRPTPCLTSTGSDIGSRFVFLPAKDHPYVFCFHFPPDPIGQMYSAQACLSSPNTQESGPSLKATQETTSWFWQQQHLTLGEDNVVFWW